MCIICQNRVTLFGVYWLLQRGGGWHIVRAGLTGYLTELQLSSMSPTAPLLVHTIGLENICFRNLCNICAIYVIHVSNRLSGCQQNWVGKYFCIFCNICCMCTFFCTLPSSFLWVSQCKLMEILYLVHFYIILCRNI